MDTDATDSAPPPGAPVRREAAGPRRPGGRSAQTLEAILDAVLREIAEFGYGAVSFERVAARAGVHRSSIYRRWPDVATLVRDAALAGADRDVPQPDTGSLRGDLRQLLRDIVANLADPTTRGVLAAVAGEGDFDSVLGRLAQQFWNHRIALAATVVRRGQDRGELDPATDSAEFVERLIAPLFLRLLVTGRPVTRAYADRLVAAALPD